MIDYFEKGHYEFKYSNQEAKEICIKENFYDFEIDATTKLGGHAIGNLIIYNHGLSNLSITEIFLTEKKYRKDEKINFLKDMLNSVESLFEMVNVDKENGYVTFKDIFDNKEYKVTDINLSMNPGYKNFYLYTRIITSENISFGTGMPINFLKDGPRIKKWINEHKKTYSKKTELTRFTTIYSLYKSNPDNEV